MLYAHSSQDGPQNCKSCGSKKWVHSGECSDCVDCGREICSECAGLNILGVLTCKGCIESLLEAAEGADDSEAAPCLDCGRTDGTHGDRCLLSKPEPTVVSMKWFYQWMDKSGKVM